MLWVLNSRNCWPYLFPGGALAESWCGQSCSYISPRHSFAVTRTECMYVSSSIIISGDILQSGLNIVLWLLTMPHQYRYDNRSTSGQRPHDHGKSVRIYHKISVKALDTSSPPVRIRSK